MSASDYYAWLASIHMRKAVVSGDIPTVRRFLREGVDVNGIDPSYLVSACSKGNEEMVRILLEAGADKEQLIS